MSELSEARERYRKHLAAIENTGYGYYLSDTDRMHDLELLARAACDGEDARDAARYRWLAANDWLDTAYGFRDAAGHYVCESRITTALNSLPALAARDAEVAALQAEVTEWKHRAVGGTCRILSNADCDCSLCQRDKELTALRAKLAEAERPCAICLRKISDAIGEDWCAACDADERLHAAKAANDELAKTIARLTEDAELQKRIRDSSAKVIKGVWADHEKQFASIQHRAESAEARVRELEAKLKSTEGCLTSYKLLYDVAINAADRVFQVDSTKPPPLLPDFLKLGDCKFEGVVKLAEAYLELQAKLAAVREQYDRWMAERQGFMQTPMTIGDLVKE